LSNDVEKAVSMAEEGFNFGMLSRPGMTTRSFVAGDIIFREGEAADELFVVKEGQVEIRRNGRVLENLGENDLFGEMALIDGAPRSASAVACRAVELVPINEKQFLYLVDEVPFFALTVMRVLARRLRSQNSAA
jgi:CRP/FNR family cyclic AMP-dependent transcriptional regulator